MNQLVTQAASLPGRREGRTTALERKRWRWSLFVGGWILLSLIVVGPVYISLVADGKEPPWSKIVSELTGLYLWALLFPIILWITKRFPIERRRWPGRLAVNVVLGLVIASSYGLMSLFKNQLILNLASGELTLPILGQLSVQMIRQFPNYLLTSIEYFLAMYAAIVAGIYAVSYYRKYLDRELEASKLETQLAVAHLDVLKMQLHPHFLFNTLNAISALMHRDVDDADRMISKLSDLLRLSLEKDDRHQVPLLHELELLDHYVAIERIRFRDRLTVTIDVASDALEALVPKLILQPLVENAIRHGIAMRSAAGQVVLRGRRIGNRLRLEVHDDGPGLPPGGAESLREGVGLANTRARLQQLYNDDHRFILRNARTGGFEVVFEVPFEIEERYPNQPAA